MNTITIPEFVQYIWAVICFLIAVIAWFIKADMSRINKKLDSVDGHIFDMNKDLAELRGIVNRRIS